MNQAVYHELPPRVNYHYILHAMVVERRSINVVRLLFDTYPEAIHVTDRVGKLAFDIAKES